MANHVLYGATRGISELITVPGLINVDFADVRTVMREMGDAVMGSGVATGENRAVEAAHAAISSPLLEDVSISGAQGVLVNVTGGPTMSLVEVDEATEIIHEAAGEEANVILGAVIDENMGDEMMVTVIATGFNRKRSLGAVVAPPSRARGSSSASRPACTTSRNWTSPPTSGRASTSPWPRARWRASPHRTVRRSTRRTRKNPPFCGRSWTEQPVRGRAEHRRARGCRTVAGELILPAWFDIFDRFDQRAVCRLRIPQTPPVSHTS